MDQNKKLPLPPKPGRQNADGATQQEPEDQRDKAILPVDEATLQAMGKGISEQTFIQIDDTTEEDGQPATPVSTAARNKPAKAKKLSPCIYTVTASGIHRYGIKEDQFIVKIGNSREAADVVVADPSIGRVQVVIVQVADQWLIMDCGTQDLLHVNGIATRQFLATTNSRCVISISSKILVFCGNETGEQQPHSATSMLDNPFKPDLIVGDLAESTVCVHADMGDVESTGGPIIIGQHELCDCFVHGEKVQPFHAMINWRPDGVVIDPLGNFDVLFNGEAIAEGASVQSNSTIQISSTRLKVTLRGEHKIRGQQLFPEEGLRFDYYGFTAIGDTPAESFTVPMDGQGITIGRGDTCDIVLNDNFASREHAQLIPSGKSLMLFDTYSSNGVYLNGERIKKARVHVGDIIEIGHSDFLAHYI
jgi:hypothetical protein